MLNFYRSLTGVGRPLFEIFLERRAKKGKEERARLAERKGKAGRQRPQGPLLWVHAASVGEAAAALMLIESLLKNNPKLNILMTTGTKTSAEMLAGKLPKRAVHQFYPLDHPAWVGSFLDHWRPDLALWLESEIWPNMIMEMRKRTIPAALINARLSEKSWKRWHLAKNAAKELLGSFSLILAQTEKDAQRFKSLGAENIVVTDNMKFSAKALTANEEELKKLAASMHGRPLWLFASTHKGEEALACRVHQRLKSSLPDILTILVPRHTRRSLQIQSICAGHNLSVTIRGNEKKVPATETDIYLADTMGELGLFYRLAPVACIGRSFSDDGGGGHNPIESAQLNCVVLHGPHVQYQRQIYDEMDEADAALKVNDENDLVNALHLFLTDETALKNRQVRAREFLKSKEKTIGKTTDALKPFLTRVIP